MTRFAPAGKAIASAMIAALLALCPVMASPVAAHGGALSGQPIPCPRADTPPVDAPRLSPPPDSPGHRVIGGERLASPGLVVTPEAPPPPAVTATSWLVADLGTGTVLGACGAHEYGTPASVQKLLLAATLLARLDPRQVVTITGDDLQFEPGSSAAGLVEGGRYTVETLWLGLLLVSGNDAANVLARLGGGAAGLAGGVAEMNALAQRLGALHTHAVTPSGLDAPGQVTTAYDLALIARACFADETFLRYALTKQAQIPAQPLLQREGFQIQNQNLLIDRYPGALGGKTGFTDLARHTYVGAAERDGRRLVVTLLGAEHAPTQGWEQGAALLDWGFAQPSSASVGRLVEPADLAVGSSSAADPASPSAALTRTGRGTPPAIALGAAAACVVLVMAFRRRRNGRGRPQR